MHRFEGKVAVITGAANGLGLATAKRFLSEGGRVVMTDISPHIRNAASELGPNAIGLVTDVTNAEQVKTMIDTAVERFGTLDILCNNASIVPSHVPMTECTVEEFDRCISVDLRGVFLGMKYALPIMLERKSGSIINISSLIAVRGMETQGAYCSAKAGVIALTQVAALEAGPSNVRVNAILPGGMLTEMAKKALAHDPGAAERHAQKFPLRRMADPAEVAAVVAFLASEDASYVTGTAIRVDGGWDAVA